MSIFGGTDRYSVIREIGSGGMGAVYEVHDSVRGVHVALKTMKGVDSRNRVRFKREFRNVVELRHPNLVRLFELHLEDGDTLFYTMELVDGQDLGKYVARALSSPTAGATATIVDGLKRDLQTMVVQRRRTRGQDERGQDEPDQEPEDNAAAPARGKIVRSGGRPRRKPVSKKPPAKRADPACDLTALYPVLPQVLDALDFLHANDIVHRDIKPENILIDQSDRVKLVDFGIAKQTAQPQHTLVRRGALGTLAYIAPEQIIKADVGPPADLYALGCVLFSLISGNPPFSTVPDEALRQHMNDQPTPLQDLVANVPTALADAVASLMSKRASDRPTTSQLRALLGFTRASARNKPDADLSSTPIVGRSYETAQLEERLTRTAEGSVQVTIATGEHGAGKTTVLGLAEERARSRGFQVFRGRCHQHEALPFRAFDKILDDLAATLSHRPPTELRQQAAAFDAICQVFPTFGVVPYGERLSDDFTDPNDPRSRRDAAFSGLCEVLSTSAEPALFVIDDLHWADRESIELLTALCDANNGVGGKLMIVGAARSEELGQQHPLQRFLDTHRGGPELLELPIPMLTEPQVGQVIERALNGAVADDVVHTVMAETRGNPFFVSETAQFLKRRSALDAPEERWRVPRLSQLVALRFQGLGRDALTVLSACAVAGGPLARDLLRAASLPDAGRFNAAMAELEEARILGASPGYSRRAHDSSGGGHPQEPPVDFHRSQYREAVYKSLKSRRADFHGRLAAAIEQMLKRASAASGSRPDLNLEALQQHWRLAGNRMAANIHAIGAAEQAATRLAFDRAAELYGAVLDDDDALEAAGGEPDRSLEDRTRIREQRAAWLGFTRDARGTAEALSKTLTDLQRLASTGVSVGPRIRRVETALAAALVRTGALDAGAATFDRLLAPTGLRLTREPEEAARQLAGLRNREAARRLLSSGGERRLPTDEDRRALKLFRTVAESFSLVRPLEATEYQLRYQALASEVDDPDIELIAGAYKAALTGTGGSMARALTALADANDRAAGSSMPMKAFYTAGVRGLLNLISGQWRSARDNLDAVLKSARREGAYHRWESTMCRVWRMQVDLQTGEDSAAIAAASQLVDEAGSDVVRYGFGAATIVTILVRHSRLDDAARQIDAWRALDPGTAMTQPRFLRASCANQVDAARGRHHDVVARFEALDAILRRDSYLESPMNVLHWNLPRYESAAALGGGLAAIRKHALETTGRLPVFARSLGHRALAILALADGDRAVAAKESQRALDASNEAGAPYYRSVCLRSAEACGVWSTALADELEALDARHGLQPQRTG